MADDSNSLGDLNVSVTGDDSELQGVLDDAISKAADAGDAISAAFTEAAGATDLAGASLSIYQQSLSALQQDGESVQSALQLMADSAATLGDDVSTAAQSVLDNLTPALQQTGEAATQAASDVEQFVPSANDAGESAHEAEGGLQAMAEGFLAVGEALAITEGLKEFGQEALTVYGTVQSVTIGIAQLTGSTEQAAEAIEQIKQMAATEPFAFPELAPTVQKMIALGVSTEQLPGVMQAAANAAAAVGASFQTTANAIDRMSLSGTAGVRQLVALGISTKDLAAAMDVTEAEVTKAFKALDQSARLEVLTTALEKFAGSAEAQAQGIAGQWQIFQNQFEEVMVAVGADLAPVVSDILAFGKTVLSVTQEAADAFKELPPDLQTVIVSVGLLAAAVVPLVAAAGAFGLALSGLSTLSVALSGVMTTLTGATAAEAGAEVSATAATAAHGLAAGAAIGPIEALAAAETQAAFQMNLFQAEMNVAAAESMAAGTQLSLLGAEIGSLEIGATAATGAVKATGVGLVGMAAAAVAVVVGVAGLVGGVKDVSSKFGDMTASLSNLIPKTQETEIQFAGLTDTAHNFDIAWKEVKASLSDVSWWDALKMSLPTHAITEMEKSVSDLANEWTGKFPQMQAAADRLASGVQGAADKIAAGWAKAAMGSVTTSQQTSDGVQKVLDSVNKLGAGVTQASATLAIMKTSFETKLVIPGTNVVATFQDVQASTVDLDKAQKALVTATDTTKASIQGVDKASTDLKQSLSALTTGWKDQQIAVDAARNAYQAVINTPIGDKINGVTTTLNTAAQAWAAYASAAQKASGLVVSAAGSIGAASAEVLKIVNSLQTLDNAVTVSNAAYKIFLDSYEKQTPMAGSTVVATLAQVQLAHEAVTKAVNAHDKALQNDGSDVDFWATIIKNSSIIVTNGTKALYDNATGLKINIQAYIDAKDGITAATTAKQAHTVATQANTDAIGKNAIQVQNNDSDTTHWGLSTDDVKASIINLTGVQQSLDDVMKAATKTQGNLGEMTNEAADAYLAEAAAADKAAGAIQRASSAGGKGGGGRGGGAGATGTEGDLNSNNLSGTQGLDSGSLIGALLGAIVGGAGVAGEWQSVGSGIGGSGGGLSGGAQFSYANYAQQLANATGQVVTIMGDTATPLQNVQKAAAAAATAQTSNTAAVTASTAAITATVPALTAAQSAFIATSALGDAIVTNGADLPQTVADFLAGVQGTLVAYDQTTGALRYTETAADGTARTLDAFSLATSAAASSTTSVVGATQILASSSTTAAGAVTSFTEATLNATTATVAATASTTQAIGSVATLVSTLFKDVQAQDNGIFSGATNPSPSSGIGSADVLQGIFGNNLPGQTPSYLGPNGPASANGGVNLTVNVTGSTANNQMLARQIANEITTQLRTTGGLKF